MSEEQHKHTEEEHIEKLICEGFDRTDWDAHPDNPANFHLTPVEEDNPDADGAGGAKGKATLIRKRVKIYTPSSVGSRLRRAGSGDRSSSNIQADERDQSKTDMRLIIVIVAITVIAMFAIYMSVVIPFSP